MINTTVLLSEIEFEEAEPGDLLESIRIRGIAIPVQVIHTESGYRCVDGRKRLTACQRLLNEKPGIDRVPVFVKGDYSKAGCSFWGAKNHH
ncbi:MAG: ParB-like nuclease domain-containing protein [Solobacterium sp.]|nr:ParB-like nuclease domain-containing protein [Solobacterium sp.]